MASHLIILWYSALAKVREFIFFSLKLLKKRDMLWEDTLVILGLYV
jgi:hypothetical protein